MLHQWWGCRRRSISMFPRGQVHSSSETNHRSNLPITKRKKDSKVKIHHWFHTFKSSADKHANHLSIYPTFCQYIFDGFWRKCDKLFHGKWGHRPSIETADKMGVFNFSRLKCWKKCGNGCINLSVPTLDKVKDRHTNLNCLPLTLDTLVAKNNIRNFDNSHGDKSLILERWNEGVRTTRSDKIKEVALLDFRVVVYLCTSTQVDPTQPLASWQV